MIGRRAMLGTTTLGSIVAAFLPATGGADTEPRAEQASEKSVEDVAAAIDRLRAELQKQQTFWELEPVRQQPMTISRDNQGRLTIMVISTMVIMRPDLTPNYVGLAYDNR